MDRMILTALKRSIEWDIDFALSPQDSKGVVDELADQENEIQRLRGILLEINDAYMRHLYPERALNQIVTEMLMLARKGLAPKGAV